MTLSNMYTVGHMNVPLYFHFLLFASAYPSCPKEISILLSDIILPIITFLQLLQGMSYCMQMSL